MFKSNYKAFLILSFVGVLFASSCVSKKKVVETPQKIEPPKVQVMPEETGNLVPFTRELFFKLRESNLDIKRLKFFVEQTIVLTKVANNGNFTIGPDGTLVAMKGNSETTIQITPTTSGAIETIEPDGVRVNFGRPGSTLKFVNNSSNPKFFNFKADKVNKANIDNLDKSSTGLEVNYNGGNYSASSGGTNVESIKLMIKQKDVDVASKDVITEQGTTPKGF